VPATSPTASPTPTVASKPPSLAIAPGEVLSLGIGQSSDAILELVLTKALFPGPSVPVTFTFANAGSITLRVPVQLTPHTGPVGITVPPLSSGANGD
jgi:copper(I)-binding protein